MKKRFYLRYKLVGLITSIVLIISSILSYLFISGYRTYVVDSAKEKITIVNNILLKNLDAAIEFYDVETTDLNLQSLSKMENIEFVVVFKANKEIFSILNKDKYKKFVDNDRTLFQEFKSHYIEVETDLIISLSQVRKSNSVIGFLGIAYSTNKIEESVAEAVRNVLVYLMFAILISVILSILWSNRIINPVKRLIEFFDNAAQGKGDLTQRLTAETNDEFFDLAIKFNEFLKSQNNMIKEIKELAKSVSYNIQEIEQRSQKDQDLVSILYSNLDMILSSADILDKTASQNVESAKNATKQSEMTIDISQKGQKSLDGSIDKMSRIKTEVQGLETDMKRLHENSKQIGIIAETLRDISDRTTILALNTTIEANKAGELGAGFAVIAEEIHQLSSESTNSLDRINKFTKIIQDDLNQSFDLTVTSSRQVDEGVSIMETTGSQINQSVESVEANLKYVEEVLNIARDQQKRVNDIMDNISSSAENVTMIRTSILDTLKRINSQRDMVHRLQNLMNQFKLIED